MKKRLNTKKFIFFAAFLIMGTACVSLQGKAKAKIAKIMSSLPEGASIDFSKVGNKKQVGIYWQKPLSLPVHIIKQLTGIAIGAAGVIISTMDYQAHNWTRYRQNIYDRSSLFAQFNALAGNYALDTSSMRQVTELVLCGFSSYFVLSSCYSLFKGYGRWERCAWATMDKEGIFLEDRKLLWHDVKGLALSADGSKITFVGLQEDYTCYQTACPIPFDALLECLKLYIPDFVERRVHY